MMSFPVSLSLTPFALAHLQCAGYEMPLSLEDEKYFGPMTKELCETYLLRDEDGW
jgi:DEAD/DEAH box helicase domain-containing protein